MMYNQSPYDAEVEPVGRYAAKTFGWMFLGLLTTFAVMILSAISGITFSLLSVPAMAVLAIAEIGVVLYLSARIEKLSILAARGMFFLYAVLNGLVFSTFLLYFDFAILGLAFLVTALYFGIMAAVGYFTTVDLTKIQPILIGGLIVLIVFNFVGMFIGLSGFERILCFAGVGLFLGFTAYDTQKIKAFHTQFSGNPEMLARASVIAALQLYLDFVNLFIYIVRLFSNRD